MKFVARSVDQHMLCIDSQFVVGHDWSKLARGFMKHLCDIYLFACARPTSIRSR